MKQLVITVEKAFERPETMLPLFNTIAFFNNPANKRPTDNETVIISMVTEALQTLCFPFAVGRGGSHIWISENHNERNIIINF